MRKHSISPRVLRNEIRTVLFVLVLALNTASCTDDSHSFCSSARSLKSGIEQIDLSDLSASLDSEFWNSIEESISQLAQSPNEDVRQLANSLEPKIREVISELENVNFDLAQILLTPEAAARLASLTRELVLFSTTQLQTAIDGNC